MKALSLWEPWATAIRAGLKTIETRSWQTKYRGPLAIHAALTKEGAQYLQNPSIAEALRAAGTEIEQLHFGCVVATCELIDCVPTTSVNGISDIERVFGDYAPGRWAWKLANIVPLSPPAPARGAQGLWEWQPAPALKPGEVYRDEFNAGHWVRLDKLETEHPGHSLVTRESDGASYFTPTAKLACLQNRELEHRALQ